MRERLLPSFIEAVLVEARAREARSRSGKTTDRAVLQLVLKVRDGADPSYSWVTYSGCDCGWPVPVFAEEVG